MSSNWGEKMKIQKEILARVPCCYAVSPISIQGDIHYLFATDDKGACVCVNPRTREVETVWDESGGTMSIVPIPGRQGEFLASQRFLPGFHALHARIVHAARSAEGWTVRPWMEIPFVHRFDILASGEKYYILCCILCDTQGEEADFQAPGYLLVGELGEDFMPLAPLRRLACPMPVNHGYWPVKGEKKDYAYVGCDAGIFRVTPPRNEGEDWAVESVLRTHASDMALADLDGDGREEMAVIEPFHGNQLVVYRREENGYQEVYRHPTPLEFIHALWGGTILGEPVFLCGSRGLDKELFFLRYRAGKYGCEPIEQGYGPSNVAVLNGEGISKLLVANREAGDCVEFTLSSWE